MRRRGQHDGEQDWVLKYSIDLKEYVSKERFISSHIC